MELVLKRIAKKKGYTIGKLYVKQPIIDEYLRGEKFIYICDTLSVIRLNLNGETMPRVHGR